MRRSLGAIVMLLLVGLLVWLAANRARQAGTTSSTGPGTATGSGSGPKPLSPQAPQPLAASKPLATGAPKRADIIVHAPWGGADGALGRKSADESAPEGPMSLAASRDGGVVVLDQVNGRVQRFGPDGRRLGEVSLGGDTAQDLATTTDGKLLVLDRLGDKELLVFDADGKPLDRIPVVGGGITEGGGVTGVFVGPDGIYLEREHQELIRVADASGTPVARGSQPGRPTRDGSLYLSAAIVDRAAGTAALRAYDHDGQIVWQRAVAFPRGLVAILLLDSDLGGHAFLGALVATESPSPPYDLTDAATIVVRVAQADGSDAGVLALPANPTGDEIFRDLAVTDDGAVLQMLPGEDGVTVTRYEYPAP